MAIGFDAGTYHLVSCKKQGEEYIYKKEVNAFLEMPLENRFVFNMMNNAGVPLIKIKKQMLRMLLVKKLWIWLTL